MRVVLTCRDRARHEKLIRHRSWLTKWLDRVLKREPWWQIEKWTKVRPYHNSPRRWGYCGLIRASDAWSAQTRAAYITGSSIVRVTMVEAALLLLAATAFGADTITVSTTSVSFTGIVGGPNPAAKRVTVTTSNGTPWSTCDTSRWFDITSAGASGAPAIITPKIAGIAQGIYSARVTFSSTDLHSNIVTVKLTLTAPPLPTPTATPTPIAATPTPTATPAPPTFVKAININGNAETIGANSWTSYVSALASGFSTSSPTWGPLNITMLPLVDAATNRMLNTGLWCAGCDVTFSQTIPNGNYLVYLWMVENYRDNYRSCDVLLEGIKVASAIGTLPNNTWQRYGPYPAGVNDGRLDVSLVRITGDPAPVGIEIYRTQGVALHWLPANSMRPIGRYEVQYATTSGGPYPNKFDAGLATAVIVPGLPFGITHFFTVIAYNDVAMSSPPSDEVSAQAQ